MDASVQDGGVTREAKTVVSTCQRGSRALMNDVINEADTPPKAIGYECLGRDDEPQWSKMRSGVRPFDLDHIDSLPRPIRVEWLIRRAHAEGLEVRDPDVVAVAYQFLGLVEQLVGAARLMRLPERADHMATFIDRRKHERKVG